MAIHRQARRALAENNRAVFFILLSYFWLVVLFRTGTSLEQGVWTNSVVQFQFFGIGALMALKLHGSTPKLSGGVRSVMLLAGVGFWLLASGYFNVFGSLASIPLEHVLMGYAAVAVGCGLLCLGVLGAPSQWFPNGVVYFGKISYGLYVFHLLGLRLAYSLAVRAQGKPAIAAALFALRMPIALLITGVLAYLSYRFFETPFLRMKERFTFVKSRKI